jgi:hypothetical protein
MPPLFFILIIFGLQRLFFFSFSSPSLFSLLFFTVCCRFSLALQSDLPLATFQFSRYLVRYTDCYSSLNFLLYSSLFILFLSLKLVCACVCVCVCSFLSLSSCLFLSLFFVLDMLRRDGTEWQRSKAWRSSLAAVLCEWESLSRFSVYRYSSTTIRIIVSLSNKMAVLSDLLGDLLVDDAAT